VREKTVSHGLLQQFGLWAHYSFRSSFFLFIFLSCGLGMVVNRSRPQYKTHGESSPFLFTRQDLGNLFFMFFHQARGASNDSAARRRRSSTPLGNGRRRRFNR
jgi:hypothetical protein